MGRAERGDGAGPPWQAVTGSAKKIGDGKIAEGVEETAKGIGSTVVEGAKFTGEKLLHGAA